MSENVSFQDAQRALVQCADKILEQIPVPQVQLSLPVDGKGIRIKASVPSGERSNVPATVEVSLSGKTLKIPVQADEDIEEFVAQTY